MNNPKARQEWIYNELTKEPNTTYSEMCSKYAVSCGKSPRTFDKDWSIANERFQEFQKKLQKEKDNARIKLERDFIKNGLKTKYERVLIIQEQIEATIQELKSGVFKEVKRDGEKAVTWERPLTPYEKAMMRRTVKQLQSEISKIEGDYAPIKQDHTTNGESLNQSTVDLSKLDLDTLKKIKDSQKID